MPESVHRPAWLASLVATTASVLGAERHPPAPYQVGRSVVMAPHGMVATSQPLAAQVGLDVLRQGGNAIDAAIAANAAIGLTEPMSCGIGGDLFALVWDAKTQKLYGLDASGRSPYRATRQWFRERGYAEIPETGPLSWSVPGCVDGWEQLRQRFGTWSFERLLAPAIRYAEEGFPVTEVIAGHWQAAEDALHRYPDAAKTYLIDGRAPRPGDVFRNPYLAASYREIARGGRDAFYKGRLAQEIVAYSDKVGGLFSLKDFADHASRWVEPVSTTYRGYQVWELPPPGQGIAALQMLNILEAYDLKAMGPTSADYWHLFLEAKKLAYADRARYYADPEFGPVPTAELISKRYAEARRRLIRPDKALTDVPAGDPKLGRGDTIYLCVVDKDRNCVSLIQSNYYGFGSGHVAGNTGFALQNRGTLFALSDTHPNRLEPHKRPFHTIIPAMVTRDGKPWLVYGVMGGDMQPQGHVQVLCNLIDFGMNIQQAGEAPRLQHFGSATPTGQPGSPDGGTVAAETGIPPEVIKELERRGHRVVTGQRNGGGFQGILIDPKTNMLHGGSEYRKDGCAVGY
ncbi:MAG: gamma-glutamyltransferase [Gemmataceae bacterium]|nr:gamma-glutamyltransferase [Gemmataceae bacterium]MDW8264773.1 gamma-glutamyltransferase [Gemmataceae bacterium]